MTSKPLLMLLTESDWAALRLTSDDIDRLVLRPCELARYIDAQGGLDKPKSEHGKD